jgi:hypothetical protein
MSLLSAVFSATLEVNRNSRPSVNCRRAFFLCREMGGSKMTDAKILTVVHKLERCFLDKTEFHHQDHLTVAVVYLYSSDFESAIDRMRASLKRFAAHHNVSGLYHETLTRFWLQQVEMRLDRMRCLAESVERVQNDLSDKNIVFKHYSRELLNSQEAKEKWMEPDLKRENASCEAPKARITSLLRLRCARYPAGSLCSAMPPSRRSGCSHILPLRFLVWP